jgi:hypothetical protein
MADDRLSAAYAEVCKAHNGIAEFRAKLLALLPIASGAGVFLLLSKDLGSDARPHLLGIGVYGAAIAVGLFLYELRGIQRCNALRQCGQGLEVVMLDEHRRRGAFRSEPAAALNGFVGATWAALIIYPMVIAGWGYVSCLGSACVRPNDRWPLAVAAGLFVLSSAAGWSVNRYQGKSSKELTMDPLPDELVRLNADMFRAENKDPVGGGAAGEEGWEPFFRRVLAFDFRISRASRTVVQNKEEMIEHVRGDNRRRTPPVKVAGGVEGDYGVVTSVITVDGDPTEYRNLRVFQRQPSGEWQCVYWRVTSLGRPPAEPGSVSRDDS